jgi:hypothetical protein
MDPNITNNSNKSNKTEHNWTNEEHLHFLQSMEASFVRTMLENNGPLLRLDRYLPDSSESTLDLKSQRKKKHGTPGKNNNTPLFVNCTRGAFRQLPFVDFKDLDQC